MKYSTMRKDETLLMYRVYITKRPWGIWQHLTDFWIKKNYILRLLKCLQLSESIACCQKSRFGRIVALCILLKKGFPTVTDEKKMIQPNWTQPNFAWYLHLILFINLSPSQTRFFTTTIFTDICRCSSWKRCTFIWLFWLC